MSNLAFTRIRDALLKAGKQVKGGDKQFSAQCPAHDDNSPSLSVTAGKDMALIHCFAGCKSVDVMAALNMDLRDLYDNPKEQVYTYTDKAGHSVRTVKKFPKAKGGKDFTQRSVRDSEKTTIYRLNDVLTAVEAGEVVYLVEGEKDADNATQIAGVTATTGPMGARSISRIDPSPFTGAAVIAVVDRDSEGKAWASKVNELLTPLVASLSFVEAHTGKDLSDHLAAGKTLDDLIPFTATDTPEMKTDQGRHLVVTKASAIKPKNVQWLWDNRMARGALSLLAGREGLGKSTLAVDIVAKVTRGTLAGNMHGTPATVIYAATEDSWEHTIVPRLIAANADLDRVLRVEVETSAGFATGLTLPKDITALETVIREEHVTLMVLDPIMSRLEGLDTHKDSEVRIALEPLVKMADDTNMSILGLIHLNKAANNPLDAVMGSKAFTAVARSVSTVVQDEDDETQQRKLFGTVKNNLGRLDLRSLVFTVETCTFTFAGINISSGRIEWRGTSETTIKQAMSDPGVKVRGQALEQAIEWLENLLTKQPGIAKKSVDELGRLAGHSRSSIERACRKLGVISERSGDYGTATWRLPAKTAPFNDTFLQVPGESSFNTTSEETLYSQRKHVSSDLFHQDIEETHEATSEETGKPRHDSVSSQVSVSSSLQGTEETDPDVSPAPRCETCGRMKLITGTRIYCRTCTPKK